MVGTQSRVPLELKMFSGVKASSRTAREDLGSALEKVRVPVDVFADPEDTMNRVELKRKKVYGVNMYMAFT